MRPLVAVTLATAVCVVPTIAPDARAASTPKSHPPTLLWKEFPLYARGQSTPANKPHAGASTATTSQGQGRGTPISAAVWAATAGAAVVALLTVAVIAGRLRVRLPSRAKRRPPIRERVAELVEAPRRPTATSLNVRRKKPRRAVRAPTRESEEAVLKRKGATLSADADAKLRAKSRNGSCDHELVLLKAKQERKP